mgnify:CR=1 FL=1
MRTLVRIERALAPACIAQIQIRIDAALLTCRPIAFVNVLLESFSRLVEAEWNRIRESLKLDAHEIERVSKDFRTRQYATLPATDPKVESLLAGDQQFAAWHRRNTVEHKSPGYRAVFISLKPHGKAPGDMTDEQMDAVAEIADRYSFGEIRVTHTQNLVLADVETRQLPELWKELAALGLATANIGTATDKIGRAHV